MNDITITIPAPLFRRLQALAEPLVDDTASVIERLLDHWDSTNTDSVGEDADHSTNHPEYWEPSGSGARLPVGAEVRGRYRGRWYYGRVAKEGIEFDGYTYPSPSAAGMAVKRSAGASPRAAYTNGWRFWEIRHPESGQWVRLEHLRHPLTLEDL